jgi:hypothetical protein
LGIDGASWALRKFLNFRNNSCFYESLPYTIDQCGACSTWRPLKALATELGSVCILIDFGERILWKSGESVRAFGNVWEVGGYVMLKGVHLFCRVLYNRTSDACLDVLSGDVETIDIAWVQADSGSSDSVEYSRFDVETEKISEENTSTERISRCGLVDRLSKVAVARQKLLQMAGNAKHSVTALQNRAGMNKTNIRINSGGNSPFRKR